MRISLALAAIVSTCGLVAQADDQPALSIEPAQPLGPVNAAAVEMDGAVMQYNDANHRSWHLPFYYGRGESQMPCPCQAAPDGTCWGCCAAPRSYHLHLWDNYCYESTRCPSCGFCLGGMAHYWMCERERNHGNCCAAPCGGACCHGCAGRAESPAAEGRAAHGATEKTSSPTRPVPPPPVLPGDEKDPAKGKDAKSAAKSGYQLYEAEAPKSRPVATWPLLERLRGASKPDAR